jgi:hypothetical protein
MMDWIYIERKYQQLKEDYDHAWENWVSCPTDELYGIMNIAKSRYFIFCTDVLEQLMEKNQDVLQRLKTGG